jgi:hypothetical protein
MKVLNCLMILTEFRGWETMVYNAAYKDVT